jgi:hypothetical protein
MKTKGTHIGIDTTPFGPKLQASECCAKMLQFTKTIFKGQTKLPMIYKYIYQIKKFQDNQYTN